MFIEVTIAKRLQLINIHNIAELEQTTNKDSGYGSRIILNIIGDDGSQLSYTLKETYDEVKFKLFKAGVQTGGR